MKLNAGIIGEGSFGTSLSLLFQDKDFKVRVWGHDPGKIKVINERRENIFYLPGFSLPDDIIFSSSMEEVIGKSDLLIFVPPSHVLSAILKKAKRFFKKDVLIIIGSKGIEVESLRTTDEIVREELGEELCEKTGFFSGPTFAREIASKMPTAGVIASKNPETAEKLQELFSFLYLRAYRSDDVKGVVTGGALKNVIAIAAGIGDGLGLGYNSRAALITRGLAEITRLGVKLGAGPLTFQGLAGVGDLVLTCTGALSRNRTVGIRLGKGEKIEDIIFSMKMVAEGIKTTKAAYNLSKKIGVEMPITEAVYEVLYKNASPQDVVVALMTRKLKPELYGL